MSVRLSSSSTPPAAIHDGKDSTVDPGIHSRGAPPERFVRHALDIFIEHDLDPPDSHRLDVIGDAALEAMSLLFAAALFDPDGDVLREFFPDFVKRCIPT
jgi:hypothetical protein